MNVLVAVGEAVNVLVAVGDIVGVFVGRGVGTISAQIAKSSTLNPLNLTVLSVGPSPQRI